MLQQFLSNTELQAQLVSFLLTGLTALIGNLVRPKVRIIWGVQHGFSFRVPLRDGSGNNVVHTGTVIVKNEGTGPANDVEVMYNFKPQHFQVWPATTYTTSSNPEGNLAIRFPTMASQEYLTIEMVSINGDLPSLLRVRVASGTVKEVGLFPAKIVKKRVIYLLYALILLGVFSIFQNIYLIIF